MDAAGAEIGGVHARAARPLVEGEQLLAFLEPPQNRRHRADVVGVEIDARHVRQEAADLAVEHADELAAARHGDAEQALDRQREGVLLVHRRDVVEPIEIGHVLQVGARLHQLLGAAMQEADMRVDALDDLAVELQHHTQHAVRRRMLRPKVDGEVAEVVRLGHGSGPE